jgi:hypothetical protein
LSSLGLPRCSRSLRYFFSLFRYTHKPGKGAPLQPQGIHLLESTHISLDSITLRNFPRAAFRPQLCREVREGLSLQEGWWLG